MTPSHLLDKFIKDFLQPNKDFLGQVRSAVNIICDFLKENCFRYSPTKVQKVVKVSTGLLGVTRGELGVPLATIRTLSRVQTCLWEGHLSAQCRFHPSLVCAKLENDHFSCFSDRALLTTSADPRVMSHQ
jgi:hypothetical protein